MSLRKHLIIGTIAAIAAVLLIAGISLMPVDDEYKVDDKRFDSSTQPEKTDNITILEKQFHLPVSAPESRFVWAADAGANKTINLTPLNFAGFLYDLDSGHLLP